MIRLADTVLSVSAHSDLSTWQNEVDTKPTYEEQVAEAQRLWPLKNTDRNNTFRAVRRKLAQMSGKLRRCAYCEDSCANQVEHILPKTLYPELVFAWENYLYACGICNPEKRDQFAVFPDSSAAFVNVQRKPKSPIVSPIGGEPVLINPRIEDPLHFLFLDLRGTFQFQADPRRDAREQARANYTINVLGLNKRAELPRCRRSAYGSYKAKLHEYAHKKAEDVSPRELKRLVGALKRDPHRTVWKEMQRQGNRIAELAPLFEQVPEAEDW